MSGGFRRMVARLWPDSLFGRLAIILFSGLVAAHVLSFGLIVFDHSRAADDYSIDYFVRDVTSSVTILDHVKAEERPAWLDSLARPQYRYVLRGGTEVTEPPTSRAKRIVAILNRETGGTGLGLAIALQLTNALHGTLALVNRSGGGLEARLEFPR